MRNRNIKESEFDKRVIARNPFDKTEWESCILQCAYCQQPLVPWPVSFVYDTGIHPPGEQLYEHDRMDNLIRWNISKHKCEHKPAEQPKPEKRISEAEMMSGRIFINSAGTKFIHHQKLCSGFGFFPDGDKCPGCDDCKKKEPVYKTGMWVINTRNGNIWQLNESETIRFNATPEDHIKPYI